MARLPFYSFKVMPIYRFEDGTIVPFQIFNGLKPDAKRPILNVHRFKSIRTLLVWKAESPEYKDSDSDFSNHCIKMHMSSVAGADRDSYYPKVIKLVAKHVKLAD